MAVEAHNRVRAAITLALLFAGCWQANPAQTDGDTASIGSGDADGDSDGDSDGDADSDADADADADSDADADADADADGDADSDSDTCEAEAYQQCGAGDDVHWFDSCDQQGAVAKHCPDDNATCVNLSPTEAACECLGHWEGLNCQTCPPNWDPDLACAACLPHWDIATDCTTCVGNWSLLDGCQSCIGNWDPGDDCETCLGNWDVASGCTTCLYHWVDEGNDCGTCPPNWDPDQDCDACLNHWVDQNDDCGTCPANWDPDQDCDACFPGWDPGADCLDCLPHFDIATACTSCVGNWDPDDDCQSCLNYWVDDDNDCGTCLLVEECDPVDGGCQAALDSEFPGLCNGSDDDCDGRVDEGCPCEVGEVQSCFLGPPGHRGLGTCADGSQICEASGEFGIWGSCLDGIWPEPEQCDDADNDCNGCDDDGQCCNPWLDCSVQLDPATPFEDYSVDGTAIYPGDQATDWKWEMSPGPCGEVLGVAPFTMNGQDTTLVQGPNADQLLLHFSLSGNYELTLTVTTPFDELSCSWLIHVSAPGLRVELCWDTTGEVDLDLHLGKIGTTADWFSTSWDGGDCHWQNCIPSGWGNSVNWGYPDVDGQPNPRLDLDNISTPGVPENINLDNPGDGDEFRVLVHYYSPDIVTHPVVNIYCGGTRLATYGVSPEVEGFDHGCGMGGDCDGDGWKVVDVTTFVDADSELECDLEPVLDELGDYWLEQLPFDWP